MTLAVFNRTIVDSSGDILPGAIITVTDNITGNVSSLFSDAAGLVAIANPITLGSTAFLQFYVRSGRYNINAIGNGNTVNWVVDLLFGSPSPFEGEEFTATEQQSVFPHTLTDISYTLVTVAGSRLFSDEYSITATDLTLVTPQSAGIKVILESTIDLGYDELARQWANSDEDDLVSGGEYSSKHWSAKSSQWATEVEDTAVDVAAGGDGYTTFSSLHWAAKSEISNIASGVSETNAAASQATASIQAAIALAAAQASGPYTSYDTYAAADAAKGGHTEGDIIHVWVDETKGDRYTAYALESSVLVFKIYLDIKYFATTTELGFVHNDSGGAAKTTNDAAWTTMKSLFNLVPCKIQVDGEIHGTAGFHWFDRILPVSFIAGATNAGFTCTVTSVMAFRLRGTLAGVHIPSVFLQGLTFKGGWSTATYAQGTIPYGSPSTEATWVYASPCEVLYADNVVVIDCHGTDSQYDGLSFPRNINGLTLINCKASICQDDGINIGGLTQAVGNYVLGATLIDCHVEYIFNKGIHLSGMSFGARVYGCTAQRCGKAAIDFTCDDTIIENFHGWDMGQPNRSDPIYSAYPGDLTNVDGFYDTSGGALSGTGIYCNPLAKSRILIKNVLIENIFDRDNRNQRALTLSNGGLSLDQLIVEGFLFNNSTQNSTYYSNGGVAIIYTAAGSNATNITNSRVTVCGVFHASNRGGRNSIRISGDTNHWDITAEHVGSNPTFEIAGTGITHLKLNAISCLYGTSLTQPNIVLQQFKYTNGATSLTVSPVALTTIMANCLVESLDVTDGHITFGAGATNFKVKFFHYKGTAFQSPKVIENRFGADGVEIDHLIIEQVLIDGTVTDGHLIMNRMADLTIGKFDGYCLNTTLNVISLDSATSNGFFIGGGKFKTAQTLLNEATGCNKISIHNLRLHSTLTVGSEIVLIGNKHTITNVHIDRDNSWATAPVILSAASTDCFVQFNIAHTAGGATVICTDSGTGNSYTIANNPVI